MHVLVLRSCSCNTPAMSFDQRIEIFTDGACSPNPGPGGYGVIIVRMGETQELSGGFLKTTNNRMEMIAAIRALEAIGADPGSNITLYSDSRYLVDMLNGGHAATWRANGWRLASRKRALNIDLWTTLLDLAKHVKVTFEWVKGHNEHAENERCDEMAVAARLGNDLPADDGYLAQLTQAEPQQLSLFDML